MHACLDHPLVHGANRRHNQSFSAGDCEHLSEVAHVQGIWVKHNLLWSVVVLWLVAVLLLPVHPLFEFLQFSISENFLCWTSCPCTKLACLLFSETLLGSTRSRQCPVIQWLHLSTWHIPRAACRRAHKSGERRLVIGCDSLRDCLQPEPVPATCRQPHEAHDGYLAEGAHCLSTNRRSVPG
jgi:hypothetical protein